jgi:hypothetical protein
VLADRQAVSWTFDLQGGARLGSVVEWVDDNDYAYDEDGGSADVQLRIGIQRHWSGLPASSLIEGCTGIRPENLAKMRSACWDVSVHR